MALKRKVLDLELRVAVLKALDGGMSLRETGKKFGCGKTQIATIRDERDLIMEKWESGANSAMKYMKKRKTGNEELNEKVWEWFCHTRSINMPVSGPLLQVSCLISVSLSTK
jgi:hypothetical protein